MNDVAVIICAYDVRPDYLTEAINSVLLQTGCDWHLIVWLDGHDNELLRAAERAVGSDPRCCVIDQSHMGLGEALDSAWQLADEVWAPDAIALLDADDRLLPGALESALLAMDASEAGLVYTDYVTINEGGRRIDGIRQGVPWERCDPIEGQAAYHLLVFSSKALRDIGGFDPTLELCPQFDATVKVQMGSPVFFLREVLYEYRLHRDQVSKRRRVEQAACMNRIRERARSVS